MIDIINQLKDTISTLESINLGVRDKIGIAINTHNRPQMLLKCVENMRKFAPPNSEIVIVDDASSTTNPVPVDFRFDKNVGISVAKNKSLELLYNRGCKHIFLFDDDTWPTDDKWWEPYCNSREPHLMYIFQGFKSGSFSDSCKVIHSDENIIAYSKPRGCMLYYDRVCLDTVGGMFSGFEKWGWEHVDLSDRIFNAGLTSFPYMDIAGNRLIYSDDEVNSNANTTVSLASRAELIAANSKLYESRFGSSEYCQFTKKINVFLTCMLFGSVDPQRFKPEDSIKLSDLSGLANSVRLAGNHLIVLHDGVQEHLLSKFIQDNKLEGFLTFHQVPKCSSNPYFYRWVIYRDYLLKNKHLIDSVICVDATDVEVLSQPNWDIVRARLITGDEISILNDHSGWMKKNHPGKLSDAFLSNYGKVQMLNAGTLGSSADRVVDFCSKIIHYWQSNGTDHVTDMLIFNYVCRTFFLVDMYHGRTVTTPFKISELNGKNEYAWIKHK